MNPEDIQFWNAVVEANGGKVSIDELYSVLDTVLTDHPEWVQLPDATSYAFYSGRLDDGSSAWEVANRLAEESDGAVGIIDNTRVGQSLGDLGSLAAQSVPPTLFDRDGVRRTPEEMARLQQASEEALTELRTRYGDFLELADAGTDQFRDGVFLAFDNPSQHFASHAAGDIITLTPNAGTDRAFARMELPKIAEGIDAGRITSVNGIPADELEDIVEIARANNFATIAPVTDPDNYVYPYGDAKVTFDDSIRTMITDAGSLDAYVDNVANGITPPDPTPPRTVPDSVGPVEDVTPPRDPVPDTPDTPRPGPDDAPRAGNGSLFDAAEDGVRGAGAGTNAGTLATNNADALLGTGRIQEIADADAAGRVRAFVADPEGRTAYLFDEVTNTLHQIEGGQLVNSTEFVGDVAHHGPLAFGSLLHSAGRNFPDAFDGLPKIHGSLGELASHMSDLRAPGWVRTATGAADDVGGFAARATKVLAVAGAAAAGAEAYMLEREMVDYTSYGLMSAEASWAYRGILTAHVTQATLDPTLVGGEFVVQEAYDLWAEQYDISPEVKEALEPSSLVEDVADLSQWLDDRAAEAGEAVRDYAISRADNPELIYDDFRRIGRLGEQLIGDAYELGADVVENLGNYASTRWDDPSLIWDDIENGAEWVWDGAEGIWDSVFGDEPEGTDAVLGDEPVLRVDVSLEDAARQFIMDREAIREAGGGSAGVFDSEQIGQAFDAAHAAGIETLTIEVEAGADPAERAGAILQSLNTALNEAEVSREAEVDTSRSVPQPEFEGAGLD